MSEIAFRELRISTRSVLERVERGEQVTITIDGRPVAELRPVTRRSRWIPRADFIAKVTARQADAGLSSDLAELAGEMADEDDLD